MQNRERKTHKRKVNKQKNERIDNAMARIRALDNPGGKRLCLSGTSGYKGSIIVPTLRVGVQGNHYIKGILMRIINKHVIHLVAETANFCSSLQKVPTILENIKFKDIISIIELTLLKYAYNKNCFDIYLLIDNHTKCYSLKEAA